MIKIFYHINLFILVCFFLFMMIKEPNSELCSKCKGRGYCGKACPILRKFNFLGKPKTHFSGSSPPEIFIGHYNYPNLNTGILVPQEYGNTEEYSMPELWHEKNFSIEQILNLRSKMIYAMFKSNIKDARKEKRFLSLMQEISMADRKVDTEIILKNLPSRKISFDSQMPVIGNPAPLKSARLEENPHINKKVDYLTNDIHVKANNAINELYKSKIQISNIIKVLSAGLLGIGIRRKLVPTRWSITATDDSISKLLLEKIRFYQETNEIMLFHSEYVGNHYEFLLLPDKFSFEVIEAKMSGSVWNPSQELFFAKDYESFQGRKNYADEVTGAYYANRLALCEYFEKIKRQASCLVMRECRPEYYAPLGVGILREASREAFKQQGEKFESITAALKHAQMRMRLPVSLFMEKSQLLKEHGRQKRLTAFI